MKPASEIAYFEVVPVVGTWVGYGKRAAEKVGSGKEHDDHIGQAAKNGKLPDTAIANKELEDDPPVGLLNIMEKKHGDDRDKVSRAYAFRLNAGLNNRKLLFVEKDPFIPLPTNFPKADFIKNFKFYKEGNDTLWASFVCDLEEVRGSDLAKKIKAMDEEHRRQHARDQEHRHPGSKVEHEHWTVPLLTLPFCFNVVDSELGASPWVVDPLGGLTLARSLADGNRSSAKGGGKHGGQSDMTTASLATIVTHGGVHPNAVSFLVVEL